MGPVLRGWLLEEFFAEGGVINCMYGSRNRRGCDEALSLRERVDCALNVACSGVGSISRRKWFRYCFLFDFDFWMWKLNGS